MAAPQQATFWPMGSNRSHQRRRGWAAQSAPSSFHIDLPGLPSLVFADSVDRPVQQHTLVLPQYDGAGDLSSEDLSFLDKDDVMSLLAPNGLGDDADSEQQVGGPDEVEEIQPQVPYVVYVFLAKMRALVVRRRRHQLGAVAESLALDSCRKRMWQRAVIARFAKSKLPPTPPPPLLPTPMCFPTCHSTALTSHATTAILLCLHARAMWLTRRAHAPTCIKQEVYPHGDQGATRMVECWCRWPCQCNRRHTCCKHGPFRPCWRISP